MFAFLSRRPVAQRRRLASSITRRGTANGLFEDLEPRCLLSIATPTVASGWATGSTLTPTITTPIGKTLEIPLNSSNSTGTALTYNVQSSNPHFTGTVTSGNTFIKLHVTGFVTGDLVFELFDNITPNTVKFITSYVQSTFYNGIIFHRVISGFVAQGGDPNAAGNESIAGQYNPFHNPDEFNSSLIFNGNGQLAMARAGNDTNSTQIFITQGPQRYLDYSYTLYGQLISGFGVFNQIMSVPVDGKDYPTTAETISSASVISDTSDAVLVVSVASNATANETGNFTITASDGTTTSAALNLTVQASANAAPSLAVDEPPFLQTVNTTAQTFGTTSSASLNYTTAVNTAAQIPLSAFDAYGSADDFNATIVDSTVHGTATIGTVSTSGTTNSATLTVTPNNGYTGIITVKVTVVRHGDSNETTDALTSQNTGEHLADSRLYTIAVGDQPITITNSTPANGSSTPYQLVTFSYPVTTATAGEFTATINWGDGKTTTAGSGTVSGSNGSFVVKGANASSAIANGTYVATVNIVHNGGAAATAIVVGQTIPVAVPRYRLYSPVTKEHLYTTDLNEYNTLAMVGWNQEGAPYDIYNSAVTIGGVTAVPFYRLYNPSDKQHLWTLDVNEKNTLSDGSHGWTYERIDGYIFQTQVTGSQALYRLYLPYNGISLHLWTTDSNEYSTLAASSGWSQEGLIGYVISASN